MWVVNLFTRILRKEKSSEINEKGHDAEDRGSERIENCYRPALGSCRIIKGAKEYQNFDIYNKENAFLAIMPLMQPRALPIDEKQKEKAVENKEGKGGARLISK